VKLLLDRCTNACEHTPLGKIALSFCLIGKMSSLRNANWEYVVRRFANFLIPTLHLFLTRSHSHGLKIAFYTEFSGQKRGAGESSANLRIHRAVFLVFLGARLRRSLF